MKKLICLLMLLLTSAFMFGATIWLPNRTYNRNVGVEEWIKYVNVDNWHINTSTGVLTFTYNNKRYYSTVYVIKE
jgi:hypothetical protein